MNKVITINLGGNAYQLEEGGYDALRMYLESATTRLAGNPDRDEILSDIERAIADKFRERLGSHKTVVEAKEVAAVLTEMGPIEADSGGAREAGAGAAGGASRTSSTSGAGAAGDAGASGHGAPPRRLYRVKEGAMIEGVCNGIAAYFNIDPTFVRIGFVLLTIFWGMGLLVYIALAVIVPAARSPEEKSAASGIPATAQGFIRRAREGYYEAMKKLPDSKTRREWSRQFRRDMRANRERWRENWHSYWATHAPAHPGISFALPFLSLLNAVMVIFFACALISVLANGTVFGRPLPGGLPVWGAALVLLLIYGVVAGPVKLARRACYRGRGQRGWFSSFFVLLDTVIWICVVGVLGCLAVFYFPELSNAFHSFPSVVHRAVDDIQTWWNQQ